METYEYDIIPRENTDVVLYYYACGVEEYKKGLNSSNQY